MISFSSRLTLGYAAVVAVSLALFLGVARLLVWQQAILSTDLLNDAEASEIGGRLSSLGREVPEEQVVERLREHAELDAALFFFEVRRADGSLLFRSANLGRQSLPHGTGDGSRATLELPELGRIRVGEYAFGRHDVHIGSSLIPVERLIERFTRVGLVLVVLLAATSLGVGWLLSRAAIAPIRAIQRRAAEFGPANLDVRIDPEPRGDDELARLSRLLNGLFGRLAAAFAQVRRFSAEAGHELRTPLSLIRLHAERIAGLPGVPAEARELAEGQLEETARLNRIVDDLLLLARLDAGSVALSLEPRSTRALLEDFGEDAAVLAADAGLAWSCDPGPDARVRVDAARVRQVLFNLLSNAVRVTPRGGAIRLESGLVGDGWYAELVDDGPGIEPARLATLFEPFATRPVPGERPHEGTGLGLALARSLVTAMGGTLTARRREDHPGMRFRLELPRA